MIKKSKIEFPERLFVVDDGGVLIVVDGSDGDEDYNEFVAGQYELIGTGKLRTNMPKKPVTVEFEEDKD